MTTLVDRIDKLVASNSGNVTDSISNAKQLTGQAPDDRRQHERDHGQDRRGAGHRRPARPERRDEQEPQRGAGRRQGGRRQPHRRDDEGQEVEPRPRPARGVPDRSRQGPGLLHRGPREGRRVALLPARALERAVRGAPRHDHDHDHDVPRRPHRDRPAGRGRVQGLHRDLGGGRVPPGQLGRAGPG